MRAITYKDKHGNLKRSLVRDTDPDSAAPIGIPILVPDLKAMDWDAIKQQIESAQHENGLYTWEDLQASPSGMSAMLNIVKRAIIATYKQQYEAQKKIGGSL